MRTDGPIGLPERVDIALRSVRATHGRAGVMAVVQMLYVLGGNAILADLDEEYLCECRDLVQAIWRGEGVGRRG